MSALDHDVLAGLHALFDDPQRPEAGSHADGARLHGLIRPDHEQGGRALTLLDRRLWHDPRRRQCSLASLTTFAYEDEQIVSVAYSEPAADLLPEPAKGFTAGA